MHVKTLLKALKVFLTINAELERLKKCNNIKYVFTLRLWHVLHLMLAKKWKWLITQHRN